MLKTISNLIGGNEVNLSRQHFEVPSQFYKDFSIRLSDSGAIDISIAIAKAKKAANDIECQSLQFEKRAEILEKAAKKIRFSKDEMKEIVKFNGMPIKYVRGYLEQIPALMRTFQTVIKGRYGFIGGRIGTNFLENEKFHKIEFRVPKKGFIYAITPSNDPRTTAVVSSIAVLLGIPIIIKPSKLDTLVPIKIGEAIIAEGYPKNGIGIVFFNSENPLSKRHNFKLCDEASIIWPFGDDSTVDNLLRLEHNQSFNLERFLADRGINDAQKEFEKFAREIGKSKDTLSEYITMQTTDHFASKIVLRHVSGRCAGIVDSDFDINLAANLIIESSMRYPIGCNSMKSALVVEESYSKLIENLKKRFCQLEQRVGDPLNEKTEIGYVDPKTVSFVEKRLDELKRSGLAEIIMGGEKINEMQLTPILAATNDEHSELLVNEISAYILCLKKSDSFREAVEEVNVLALKNPKLAVSYFTQNPEHMKLHINAHHLKINYLTTDVEGIIHEGNDYIMQLTKPHVVHLQKEHTKKHPYRED